MKIVVLLAVCVLVAVKAEADDDKVDLVRRLVKEFEDEKQEEKVEEKKDYGTALLKLLGKRCYNSGQICNRDVECCRPQRCMNNICQNQQQQQQQAGNIYLQSNYPLCLTAGNRVGCSSGACNYHGQCCSQNCIGGRCVPCSPYNGQTGQNNNGQNNYPQCVYGSQNQPGCMGTNQVCYNHNMCCSQNCVNARCVPCGQQGQQPNQGCTQNFKPCNSNEMCCSKNCSAGQCRPWGQNK